MGSVDILISLRFDPEKPPFRKQFVFEISSCQLSTFRHLIIQVISAIFIIKILVIELSFYLSPSGHD